MEDGRVATICKTAGVDQMSVVWVTGVFPFETTGRSKTAPRSVAAREYGIGTCPECHQIKAGAQRINPPPTGPRAGKLRLGNKQSMKAKCLDLQCNIRKNCQKSILWVRVTVAIPRKLGDSGNYGRCATGPYRTP